MDVKNLPDFDSLPPVEGMPQGCAWGVFDKDGKKDLLGTLNLLTPEVVKAAAAEVKDGISISLNWPINALLQVPMPRKGLDHAVKPLSALGMGSAHGFDDEVSFNTQCSSQWDSLVHWQHQPTGTAYNGIKPTADELSKWTTADNTMPTLDHWHSRGGLVARGVLIDYAGYAAAKGLEYHALDAKRITVQEMEEVAGFQGVEFEFGDVLLVRTGFTDVVEDPNPMGLMRLAQGKLSGVHGSVETARWLWNKRFAAVASDNMSFEAFPPVKEDGSPAAPDELVLHSYCLSLFGMSLGEMWDLGKLAAYCKKTGRYSFMLTSSPLNVPCLVGSPPNAIAIF